jgi:hypothetical protein
MTLHEVLNVSLPQAIAGRQFFVPRPDALMNSGSSLHEFIHGALHFKLANSEGLIMSSGLAHRFIHNRLPEYLN